MSRYLLRRLLLLLPTWIGITLVTFLILALVPGGPNEVFDDGGFTPLDPQLLEQFRAEHHLDDPVLVRYGHWLGRIARLDFGRSFRDHRPVSGIIAERLPYTLVLNVAALGLMFALALPLGWLSAAWRGGWYDRTSALLLYLLYCIPNFALALILQMVLAARWNLLPLQGVESTFAGELGLLGRLADRSLHMLLPTICLTYGGLAYLARFARSGLLESIRQEYVTVARAKGLSRPAAVLKHAVRNSLIPLLTLIGMLVPALVSGSVIIERIFSWPGIGRLFFTAVDGRDYPVIMGLTTLTALLSLLGLLIADLLYAWADPRIAGGRRRAA